MKIQLKYLIAILLQTNLFHAQLWKLKDFSDSIYGNYDVTFIGERHELKAQHITLQLLKSIKLSNEKIFVEGAYSNNFEINNSFNDSTRVLAEKYKNDSDLFLNYTDTRHYKLLGYFYSKGLKIKSIDVLNLKSLEVQVLIEIFNRHQSYKRFEKELNCLRQFNSIRAPRKKRKVSECLKCTRNLINQIETIDSDLGNDLVYVQEYLLSLESALLAYLDPYTYVSYISNCREGFMEKMLSNDLNNAEKIVSLNGGIHVYLNGPPKVLYSDGWIPLATRVKRKYPNKKISSIYLLNLRKDKVFKKTFPNEYKLLKREMNTNEPYIKKLIGSEGEFLELSRQFTYIVVYE